jgi:hypothetical protein
MQLGRSKINMQSFSNIIYTNALWKRWEGGDAGTCFFGVPLRVVRMQRRIGIVGVMIQDTFLSLAFLKTIWTKDPLSRQSLKTKKLLEMKWGFWM